GLADRAMNDTPLVRAIAHLTGFRVLHRAHDIRRHGADLGVRHQSTRAEDLAQLTHDAHGVGARDDDVEIELAGLHLLGEILEAHDIGARFARRILILARREDRNAHRLADAVRQHRRAADLLVGLRGVDAEVYRDVHGFAELRLREFLDDFDRFIDRVLLAGL